MRFSGQAVRNMYINNPYVQDLIETALAAGGAAGYQGLFTDMSAEDIGKSTALGALVALAARPVGGFAGKHLGRHIDKASPNALNSIQAYVPVTRDGSAAYLKWMRRMNEGSNDPASRLTRDALKAKRNLSGPDAGNAEAILSYYGRSRADNFAQGGIALATPFFVGGEEDTESLSTT